MTCTDRHRFFKGKKVTVIGLGNSGLSASLLLYSLGAEVRVTEKNGASLQVKNNLSTLKDKGIGIEVGLHSRKFIENSDLVIVSPGVRLDSEPVKWAREKNIKIIGEIELGYLLCKSLIIAITGTNGKSSVTSLIAKILKHCGKKVIACGNIGIPFTKVLPFIDNSFIVVLEVSSFQLESIDTFKPYISVILNISSDHMDRYNNFDDYKYAKAKIFKNQTLNDWAVLNYDDKNMKGLEKLCKAKVKFFGLKQDLPGIRKILTQDLFKNLKLDLNFKACLTVAEIMGLNVQKSLEAISQFRALPHRLEYVETISNIDFINDSKSTNPASTIWALCKMKKPVILLAGGLDKNLNFYSIKNFLNGKVKYIVAFGECKDKIHYQLKNIVPITKVKSMKEAVPISYNLAKSGDIILLSPMAASFDEFTNFEHRGDVFKEIVRKLKNKRENRR